MKCIDITREKSRFTLHFSVWARAVALADIINDGRMVSFSSRIIIWLRECKF